MRPISLEFQAFGPYAGHESINFEKLASNGLFLICGETGSGKTMMLDAMTYALYGKSSGHGRDDFMAMRCTNADVNTPTFVKFIFENGGVYYLFERRLTLKRTAFSSAYSLMKKDEDGVWRTLLENPKDKDLNAKAKELIGLEYDQFRQVIVLPQGQFERLLTSNSDEKEKILTSIFGEDKWQIIAEKFYESCKERSDELRSKKERIVNSLNEEGCNTIADLILLVQQKENDLQDLTDEYERADYETNLNKLQEDKALVNRFGDLHKVEDKKEQLISGKAERDSKSKTLSLAKKAEIVRPSIEEYNKCAKELVDRQREKETAENNEKIAKEKAEDSTRKLQEHVSRSKEIEQLRAQIVVYNLKISDYENIQTSHQNYLSSVEKCDETKNALLQIREKNSASSEKLQKVKKDYDLLREEHSLMLDSYINEISGILAKDLAEGKPCPVCGSLSHPSPAKLSDESVTKESVDAKEEEVNTKKIELDECMSIQEKGNAEEKELEKNVSDAEANKKIAEESYSKLMEGLIDGINDLESLKTEIACMEKKVEEYDATKVILELEKTNDLSSHVEMKTKIDSANTELVNATANVKKAENELSKSISLQGFGSKEEVLNSLLDNKSIETLQTFISEYDAEVVANENTIKELSAELKGKKEPNSEEIERLISEINDQRSKYIEIKSKIETEKNRLSEKADSLQKHGKDIEKNILEADNDLSFAKALRGDTGTGLQRYVLGIMFSSVVSAANRMLELVHGGRYRLFRSDDKVKGSNKKGLELKVYDKYSDDPEGRFVNTLSGGEKFLVSLALSIGMSTVAQKSGIKIEALFIDEGFGSLDENSIVDAMNILNSIQAANGMVGIISHVQILQDRIPTKLVVSKSEGMSHIRESIG